MHTPNGKPTPMSSRWSPLSIDMLTFLRGAKMAKTEKKKKLKNRDLIQNPYINWNFWILYELQPGSNLKKNARFGIL